MEDLSQSPVTKEMFYQSQKAMAETIKELAFTLKEITTTSTELNETVNAYIQDDTAWKKTAQPVIEMGNNARGASTVMLYITGVVIAIGGAYQIVKSFLNK